MWKVRRFRRYTSGEVRCLYIGRQLWSATQAQKEIGRPADTTLICNCGRYSIASSSHSSNHATDEHVQSPESRKSEGNHFPTIKLRAIL